MISIEVVGVRLGIELGDEDVLEKDYTMILRCSNRIQYGALRN
jgi:hypothetical protein